MTYTIRRDVENALSSLEGYIDTLGSADLTEVSSCYEDVRDSFSNLESEMAYLTSEHEEYDDLLEEIESRYGSTDPDDWDLPDEDEMKEIRERNETLEDEREKNEQARLKMANVIIEQGKFIGRLRDQLARVESMSREAAAWTMFDEDTKLLPAPSEVEVVENFGEQGAVDPDQFAGE